MRLNVLGPMSITKQVLPHMLQRRQGHIVVTSSVAGKLGAPCSSTYSATKHAVQGFFNSLRMEVCDRNVQVTMVCPGPVLTDGQANAATGTVGKIVGQVRVQAYQRGRGPTTADVCVWLFVWLCVCLCGCVCVCRGVGDVAACGSEEGEAHERGGLCEVHRCCHRGRARRSVAVAAAHPRLLVHLPVRAWRHGVSHCVVSVAYSPVWRSTHTHTDSSHLSLPCSASVSAPSVWLRTEEVTAATRCSTLAPSSRHLWVARPRHSSGCAGVNQLRSRTVLVVSYQLPSWGVYIVWSRLACT